MRELEMRELDAILGEQTLGTATSDHCEENSEHSEHCRYSSQRLCGE